MNNKEQIKEMTTRCAGCHWDGFENCVKRPGEKCLMRAHLSEDDIAYLQKQGEPPEPIYIDRNQIRFYQQDYVAGLNDHYTSAIAEYDQIMSIQRAKLRSVVEARWIEVNNPNFSPFDGSKEYVYLCSNCGKKHETKSAFCEHCGADMRGKNNERKNHKS